ncbi:hypothetical protein PQJ73_27395, partial [Rhodoplanes tepidamans]|nr:hypothetical protein [Rhodoplanes tepidamans]
MTNEPVRGTAKAGRLKALRMLSLAAVLVAAGGLGAAAQPVDPRLDRNRPAAAAKPPRAPAAQTPRAGPVPRLLRPPQLQGPRGPAGPSVRAHGLSGPGGDGPGARVGLPARPDLPAGTPGLRPAGRPGLAARPDAVRPNPLRPDLRPDLRPGGDPRLRDPRGERGPTAGLPTGPRPG